MLMCAKKAAEVLCLVLWLQTSKRCYLRNHSTSFSSLLIFRFVLMLLTATIVLKFQLWSSSEIFSSNYIPSNEIREHFDVIRIQFLSAVTTTMTISLIMFYTFCQQLFSSCTFLSHIFATQSTAVPLSLTMPPNCMYGDKF
jgi:hypothetical protein